MRAPFLGLKMHGHGFFICLIPDVLFSAQHDCSGLASVMKAVDKSIWLRLMLEHGLVLVYNSCISIGTNLISSETGLFLFFPCVFTFMHKTM